MKQHTSTDICKALILIIIFPFFSFCKSVVKDSEIKDEYYAFLKSDTEADELFRVLIISDRYDYSQMKCHDQLKRVSDPDGDSSICNKLKEFDKINEVCEGVLTVWLYPDSGKLMKIRPKILAPIAEINSLIVEDCKRWNFEFDKNNSDNTEQNMFDIKYRVVLRKMQSDEEIMKEIREREKKEGKKKELKANG